MCIENCGGDFPSRAIRQLIHTTSKIRGWGVRVR